MKLTPKQRVRHMMQSLFFSLTCCIMGEAPVWLSCSPQHLLLLPEKTIFFYIAQCSPSEVPLMEPAPLSLDRAHPPITPALALLLHLVEAGRGGGKRQAIPRRRQGYYVLSPLLPR